MRISDWSSDVCSSDLRDVQKSCHDKDAAGTASAACSASRAPRPQTGTVRSNDHCRSSRPGNTKCADSGAPKTRSEEHTSELQSLMRISYAVFCLNKKHNRKRINM